MGGDHAWSRTIIKICRSQPESNTGTLDGVLFVEPEMPVSRLTWLHRGATSYSPSAIRAEVDKLLHLRRMEIETLDLSMIPDARRRCSMEQICDDWRLTFRLFSATIMTVRTDPS